MKCPRCWTEKAYLRPVSPIRRLLLSLALLVPMKCQHCYHKFTIPWFLTIGKRIEPPVLRIAPVSREAGPSYAARHHATTHQGPSAVTPASLERRRRADAA